MDTPTIPLSQHIARQQLESGPVKVAMIQTGDRFSIWWNQGFNAEYAKRVLAAALAQMGGDRLDS